MRWSGLKFRSHDRELKERTKKLAKLQTHEDGFDGSTISALKADINCILEHMDLKWKQRAKQSWYRASDRNTPFYHA
jgi:hypothetical protein